MKPWLPHHIYTSVHREYGGLRYLELVRQTCGELQKNKSANQISILCIGSEKIALSLTALNYQITVIGQGDAIERLKRDMEGTQLSCEIQSEIPTGKIFDIACIEGDVIFSQKIPATHIIGRLACRSVSQGQIFLREKSLQLENIEPLHNRCTQYLAKSLAGLINSHPKRFHALDSVVTFFGKWTPLTFVTEFFFIARQCDPKKSLVMHVVPTLGAGGAERVVFDIAQTLPDKGYEIQVISIIRGGEMVKTFLDAHVHVRILFRRGFAGILAMYALWRIMRIMNPQIVHTHLFGADIWGGIAARLAGIRKLVSTEHSINKDYTSKHIFIKRWAVPLFRQFVAVSTETEQYLHAVQGVPFNKISVVKNGIDTSRIITRGNRPFATEPKLIIVARLIPSKGHRILFQALSRIESIPWRLQVVGSGPEEAALHFEAERLGILSRIEWLGYRTDVPELLSQADLFCFPSEWEGLGLALIEAAATGIPIIASDLPALREVSSEDNINFVPSDDVEAWTKAIEKRVMFQEQAIRQALHEAPIIQQRFNIERMTVGYAAVYRRLISV
ncbi:glycosyltransferase [Candidatus Uhrbacteria bacterium]|nr:glycosyltransferase [Candidatus Uhrbacteria bacterium]